MSFTAWKSTGKSPRRKRQKFGDYAPKPLCDVCFEVCEGNRAPDGQILCGEHMKRIKELERIISNGKAV